MNDEIKEILDYFRKYATIRENTMISEIEDYITNLEQANERLKETNVYCNRTDCSGRLKDSRKYDSVYQEKEDYKSRVEKAIEYINKHTDKLKIIRVPKIDFNYNDLLNILQNGDNSNA